VHCFSHSRHAFLQEYSFTAISVFRHKPFFTFNRPQRSVPRRPFYLTRIFFRQVCTFLKIDVPLLFLAQSVWAMTRFPRENGTRNEFAYILLTLHLQTEYKTHPGLEFSLNISRWYRETILPIFLFVHCSPTDTA
jgi:hypothetical protein